MGLGWVKVLLLNKYLLWAWEVTRRLTGEKNASAHKLIKNINSEAKSLVRSISRHSPVY